MTLDLIIDGGVIATWKIPDQELLTISEWEWQFTERVELRKLKVLQWINSMKIAYATEIKRCGPLVQFAITFESKLNGVDDDSIEPFSQAAEK